MSTSQALVEIIERRTQGKSIPNAREVARQATERRFRKRETETLAWLGATGAITSDLSDLAKDHIWENVQPPAEIFKAIRSQYPQAYGPLSNEEIVNRILEMPEESRAGFLQGVKGKLFEMRVVDNLNGGEAVGGLALEPGQTAELATSATHPGSDILIHNADGSFASELSAKCSEYASVANRAFARYPDIPVVGNEELAALNGSVIDSGITNDSLVSELFQHADTLEGASEIAEILEPLSDFAPGLPLLFVIVRHGKPVVLRQTSIREAMRNAGPDAATAVAFSGVAVILAHFDMGLLSVPLLVGGRLGYRKWKDQKAAEAILGDALKHLHLVVNSSPRFDDTQRRLAASAFTI